jgi:hypothetical protein
MFCNHSYRSKFPLIRLYLMPKMPSIIISPGEIHGGDEAINARRCRRHHVDKEFVLSTTRVVRHKLHIFEQYQASRRLAWNPAHPLLAVGLSVNHDIAFVFPNLAGILSLPKTCPRTLEKLKAAAAFEKTSFFFVLFQTCH